MGKVLRALGMMSGTSLDGIDVALIETDGENHVHRGPATTYAYDGDTRRVLVAALADAKSLTDRAAWPASLANAEQVVTERHGAAVEKFLAQHHLDGRTIDVIGFHGQTVLHRPDGALTIQLGCGRTLAQRTGLPVVFDLRAADVAAGGQGAPLVPVYHRALTAHLADRPLAIVNIGGVANVTWIGGDDRLIAFDTGPGNALLDDWMIKTAGVALDEDGLVSARGKVHDDVVRFYLSRSFFSEPPPKSLDRNAFFWDLIDGLSVDDGAATLAALTAGAIAKAREHMPQEPALWIVCGGGRRNKTIMSRLAGLVENAVVPAEAVGLNGDSVEAEAWAYLAVRSLKRLPITFPGTTGVTVAMSGGVVAQPERRL